MKRTNKVQWKQFEQQVTAKKTGTKEQLHIIPEDFIVHGMSPISTSRMKKYEPLDARDFAPLTDVYELFLENIKIACERHYRLPKNSRAVLVSDRGPYYTRINPIKGNNVSLVRFLENREQTVVSPDKLVSSITGNFSVPVTMISNVKDAKHVALPPSDSPQSVSITALLRNGKLVKRKVPKKLSLEYFDSKNITWKDFKDVEVLIKKESFAKGAFREAFKATSSNYSFDIGLLKSIVMNHRKRCKRF